MEDKDLIELIVKDKHKGFRELLNAYKQPIYWHIRKIVYTHDDADDITQNVFIKVYESLKNFKGDSKLSTWIYTIATHESINFIRSKAYKNKMTHEKVSYELAKNLETDEFFDGDEAMLKLQQAISQLPEKQKLVFNMKYFDDLKYEEIADVLGTSVGALKSSFHIASKKIEEFLTVKI